VSRRKKSPTKTPTGGDAHVLHGELPLKCPYGHDLGAIVATRHAIRLLTRDQFQAFKDGEEVSDLKSVIPGEAVGELCFHCKQERPHDKYWYKQPWDVVKPHLEYESYAANSGERSLALK
jgi:hypothetical protein